MSCFIPSNKNPSSDSNTKIDSANKQDRSAGQMNVDHFVALLVSSDQILTNRPFIFSFFLSYRVFISGGDLLKLLFEKTVHFISNQKVIKKETVYENLFRFVTLLSEWAKYFPHDFRSSSMIEHLKLIKNKCLFLEPHFIGDFQKISMYLLRKNDNLTQYETYLKNLHFETLQKADKKLNQSKSIKELCENDPRLLAIQLTHIEFDRLVHIGPEEFIHYFLIQDHAGKKGSDSPQQASKHQSKFDNAHFNKYLVELKRASNMKEIFIEPVDDQAHFFKTSSNLEAYIVWFNRLSNMVASEVVNCAPKQKRAELIEFFLDVAYSCFELGNFNSTMAIIAAMNLLHVARLKKTWLRVDKTKLDILTASTDSSNNYYLYRKILSEKINATKCSEMIIIPIFSIVMRDLNGLFYSLPSKVFMGYLNMERFWEMAQYISKNIMNNNKRFKFVQNNEIINYLLTEPILTVEASAYASFMIEEPEGFNEMKYYKELKYDELLRNLISS